MFKNYPKYRVSLLFMRTNIQEIMFEENVKISVDRKYLSMFKYIV